MEKKSAKYHQFVTVFSLCPVLLNNKVQGPVWCHIFLIPALRIQRQANLCEFKASLVYVGVPGHSGVHSETLFQNKQTKQKK